MAVEHDLAEISRSASEASKINLSENVELTRYQNPPADTCYPLEYAFYLLGDVRRRGPRLRIRRRSRAAPTAGCSGHRHRHFAASDCYCRRTITKPRSRCQLRIA